MGFLENNKEDLKNMGASVAAVISGIGSYFSSTHKTLCWAMVGIGAVFLIGTAYLQAKQRTRVIWATHAMMGFAVLVLVFVGYSDLHKAPPLQSPSTPVLVQQGPVNNAPVETNGDNAPAIGAGSNNTVNYAGPATRPRKASK